MESNLHSVCIMSDYGSLHLLPYASKGSLSDDNWTRNRVYPNINYLSVCLFAILFDSTLGLWPMEFSVPVTQAV